jgi:hypothetical protein
MSSSTPAERTTKRSDPARQSPSGPARAHLGPGLPDRGQAAVGGHQRRAVPRPARHRETPPHHHLPAVPDRGLPRGTAARDEQGPDPLSKVRVEAGRRRRRRQGFARRPQPAATTKGGGGGRGAAAGGGWRPRRPRGGERARAFFRLGKGGMDEIVVGPKPVSNT